MRLMVERRGGLSKETTAVMIRRMSLRRIIWLILLAACPLSVPAKSGGDRRTCAVMTFDAKDGVTTGQAALLSDRFAAIVERSGGYTLLPRSKMAEVLKLQEYSRSDDCGGAECAIEAGRLLTVRFMIYGSVGKIGSLYTINSYLVDVETGATLQSAITDHPGTIEDLLTRAMAENASKLLGEETAPAAEETAGTPLIGYLDIDVWPANAVIHVDRQLAATGSVEVLADIVHEVKVTARGYEAYSNSITLNPGQRETVSVTLKKRETVAPPARPRAF